MKVLISVIETRGRIIFNPPPTKETDNIIRGPSDARKVVHHFQKSLMLP